MQRICELDTAPAAARAGACTHYLAHICRREQNSRVLGLLNANDIDTDLVQHIRRTAATRHHGIAVRARLQSQSHNADGALASIFSGDRDEHTQSCAQFSQSSSLIQKS